MSKYDKLKQKNTEQRIAERPKYELASRGLEEMALDARKTADVYQNAEAVLDDIDARFEEATGLGADDALFLFFAVALQCVRQSLMTNFKERKGDQEAAKETKGHNKEHSSREEGEWFEPTPDQIISNPVPYDALRQSDNVKKLTGGALKGAGDLGHRLVLGHDAILGWIFGTANISTSTLTTWKFQSYHVRTVDKIDTMVAPVATPSVIQRAIQRYFTDGTEGVAVLVTSLFKEWVHLKSDINTKDSLPFPILSTISPKLVNKLADYGIDMANISTVAKQAGYAEAINLIIGILHGMYCYAKYMEKGEQYSLKELSYMTHEEHVLNMFELSKVKTRKILMWSNIIASASNIIAVSCIEVVAASTDNAVLAEKGLRYVDIGGYMITLHRLISDTQFIRQVKSEFLEKEWQNAVLGEEYSFLKEAEKYEQ